MKLLKSLTLSLLFSVALWSCGPQISDEKMAELDELDAKLDSSSQLLNSVDSARAMQAVQTYEKNLHYIQYDLKDTLPREEAFFVDSYYRLRKIMRKYGENYTNLSNEIVSAEQQLTNLRKDVKNGLIEAEQFDEYLTLERENVESIFYATKGLIEPFKKALPLYQEKNPRIDSLINSFEAKQMNE